jgi:hypothetical protein
MHFDFLEREGLADHGFLLDICDATAPKFVSAGAILLEEADLTSTPELLSVVRSRSLLGQFAGRWKAITETKAPVVSEYEFETPAGYRVYCRGVLLPLSACGSMIDHVVGVINWRSEKVG